MPKTQKETAGWYKVNVGVSYPPGKHANPGDVVDDIPQVSIARLVERGIISPVKKAKTRSADGHI